MVRCPNCQHESTGRFFCDRCHQLLPVTHQPPVPDAVTLPDGSRIDCSPWRGVWPADGWTPRLPPGATAPVASTPSTAAGGATSPPKFSTAPRSPSRDSPRWPSSRWARRPWSSPGDCRGRGRCCSTPTRPPQTSSPASKPRLPPAGCSNGRCGRCTRPASSGSTSTPPGSTPRATRWPFAHWTFASFPRANVRRTSDFRRPLPRPRLVPARPRQWDRRRTSFT